MFPRLKCADFMFGWALSRSEEHTSELQSLPTRRSSDLVQAQYFCVLVGGLAKPPLVSIDVPQTEVRRFHVRVGFEQLNEDTDGLVRVATLINGDGHGQHKFG